MEITDKFLSKITTNNLKGLCILTVIISHFYSWICPINPNITKFLIIMAASAVSFFLFMSGYGNFLSIKKEFSWKKMFFLCARIYIVFFICCSIFWLNVYLFDITKLIPQGVNQIIHDFTLMSVNHKGMWYLKAQLLAYLSLFIGYKLVPSKNFQILVWLFWIIEIPVAILLHKQGAWFVSSLAFPLGVSVAFYKDKIIENLNKINLRKCLIILSFIFLILILFRLFSNSILGVVMQNIVGIYACVFALIFSAFKELSCQLLEYTGKHSLELYIVHAIILQMLCAQEKIPSLLNLHNTYSMISFSGYFILYLLCFIILSYILGHVLKLVIDKIMHLIKRSI